MCTCKRIIPHPGLKDLTSVSHRFDGAYLGDQYYITSHVPFLLKWSRSRVNHDNIDSFYLVDEESGNTHPLYLEVACGKCEECIGQKVSTLKNSIKLEMAATGLRPWFLTLTYRPSCLPPDGVNKKHVQSFLKRLRSRLAYHFESLGEFRVFYVSEYGSQTHRPHYHMLIFGIDPLRYMSYTTFHTLIADCWRYGFTNERQCDIGCAKYVAKYLYKSSNVPEGKNPNFRVGSIRNGGLGSGIVGHFDVIKQLLENPDPVVKVMLYGSVVEIRVPTRIIKRAFGCTLDIARHRYGKFVRDTMRECLLLRSDPEIRYMVNLPSRKDFDPFQFCEVDLVKVTREDVLIFRTHVTLREKAQRLARVFAKLNKLKRISLFVQDWAISSYLCDKVMTRLRQSAQQERDLSFYYTEYHQTVSDNERHPS